MALGILDLSIVTDTLRDLLTASLAASQIWAPNVGPPFNVNITGEPPDAIASSDGCQLSVYLFHVSADPYQRNSPVTGPFTGPPKSATRVPPLPFQPLSLDLYYMLTAYSSGFYAQEQQVLSMALKCFHENPVVTIGAGPNEFCLTLEVETADEIGRLWQAIASPLRLSTIYKVSVVFVQPPDPPPLGPPVTRMTLEVDSAVLPVDPSVPQVFGTFTHVDYVAPLDPRPATQPAGFDLFPATITVGQQFLVAGAGLVGQNVFLVPATGPEIDISLWEVPAQSAASKLALTAQNPMPPAGIYTLTVGTGTFRSNAVPISVAALVDVPAAPILTPVAGTYTITGQGFIPTATEVLLDTVALAPVGGPPGQGQFQLAGNTITFQLPSNLPNGRYAVRVRVNGVESAPAAWITKP